jgi:large subunit ribosomal protein L9
MEIILLKDVVRLGSRGDLVRVADGYGRNYLIPKGLALRATPGNLRRFEEEKRIENVRGSKLKRGAETLAKSLEELSLTAVVKVGEDDKLFGSVTAKDIADLLEKEGFEIEKRQVDLVEPIRELGVFQVPIDLHPDVEAKVKVWVVKE